MAAYGELSMATVKCRCAKIARCLVQQVRRHSTSKGWWNCVHDLARLMRSGPKKHVVQRKALQKRRFPHGDASVQGWMHRHCTVPRDECCHLA